MGVDLNFELSFRDEDSKQAASILKDLGAKNVKEGNKLGLTGIEIVVGAILAAQALANLVIKLLPLWKCGVVVDVRKPTISMKKNCDLPSGTVLVINLDGTQSKLYRPSQIQIDSSIKKALSGAS